MIFLCFISFVILLRVAELIFSKLNEKKLLALGAVEYGKEHYPFMILLHASFLCAVIFEYFFRADGGYSRELIVFYLALLFFKLWVIWSLGKFWNTKVLRIPNFPLVTKGPYRFLKHPNYWVVVFEIALIPLAFHLYYTAIIFSILNLAMLYVRIKVENLALCSNTSH